MKKNSLRLTKDVFIYYSKSENKSKLSEPRILIYDLETSPLLSYTWGRWEQNVIDVERDWYILSFAYRWLGSKTRVLALPDFKTYKKNPEDDKELVSKLWALFNEADIIVAHNNNAFDAKKSNARFIQNGLPPPSPYKSIDTLLIARKYFKFSSNKLDDLGKDLNVGRKAETGGYSLWRDCLRGDTRAWKKMKRYNKQDVELLTRIYLRLLPWSQNTVTRKANACPTCGSLETQSRGYVLTTASRFRKVQCQSCGGWSRERVGEKVARPLVSL